MVGCMSCGRNSYTGVMCQACIEYAWPDIVVGDGEHWILRKSVTRADLFGQNCYWGAYMAPYKVGRGFIPLTVADWLLSPLGALKEFVHGSNDWPEDQNRLFVLTAIARIKETELQERGSYTLFIRGRSAVRVLEARRIDRFNFRGKVISPSLALKWLDNQAKYEEEIADFEKKYRLAVKGPVQLPPSLPPHNTPERGEFFDLLLEYSAGRSSKINQALRRLSRESFLKGSMAWNISGELKWNESVCLQRMVREVMFILQERSARERSEERRRIS